jgi:hypothetical protein
MAAAPLPPPNPGPAPPERDPVAAWAGPVPALEPPGLFPPPAVQEISGVMEPAARVEGISLLAKSASPPQARVTAPTVEPPPAEPATTAVDGAGYVEVAEAPLPVPIPVPRPAHTDPDVPMKFASLTSPLPKTRPSLDRTALIGIFNLNTGRKALLRLPNGRYRSVIVGDVLDGWRVSMIGVDAMRITRSGEDRTFLLVNH